jgi:hypothetical protein
MAAELLPVLFVSVFVLIGVGLFFAGIGTVWTGYQIRSAEPDSVTDAADGGTVELEGTAEPIDGETIQAPFTGEECLAYTYEVEEYHHDDDGSNWDTKDSGGAGVPFELLLDTGSVVVRADEDPSFDVSDDRNRIHVDGGEAPPDRVREFIEDNDAVTSENHTVDLGITELSVGSRRRYTEQRLVPGETTFVAGVARNRSAATDVSLPRSASAVVGPPEVSGFVSKVQRRLTELPFTVSDAPMDEAAKRKLGQGALLTVFALVWLGISSFVFLGFAGPFLS